MVEDSKKSRETIGEKDFLGNEILNKKNKNKNKKDKI
jgi:hypothetical protein